MRGLIPECCAVYRIQDGYDCVGCFLLLESLIGASQAGQFYPKVVYKVQNFMILCTKQFAHCSHVEKNV